MIIGHKVLLDWLHPSLGLVNFLPCGRNDTIYLNLVKKLTKSSKLQTRCRHTDWIPIFSGNNGFLFNGREVSIFNLVIFIFLPMTLKKK